MVKVIIERRVKPGAEEQLEKLLMEMRSQAMYHCRGYVSGEVLTSVGNPSEKVIIGTFVGHDDWKEWEKNPVRKDIVRRIRPLLAGRDRTKVYAARP